MRLLARPPLRRLAWALPAIAVALAPRLAAAEGRAADKAAAESLFDEGKKLFLAKKYADACPQFERSQRLDPGIGTLLFLADCYEHLGHTASAWATFREAASAAREAGQSEREQVARRRADLLQPKLFRLTLKVPGAEIAGLMLKRNDVEVPKEAWNLPVPVDPGPYNIELSAPGKLTWSASFQVPTSPGERTIALPRLENAPAKAEAPDSSPTPERTPPLRPVRERVPKVTPPPPPSDPRAGAAQQTAGVVIIATGLASLTVGSVFGILAVEDHDVAAKKCIATRCADEDSKQRLSRARTEADVATATFVGGGALVLAGAIVMLTIPRGPNGSTEPTQARRAPERTWVSPTIGRSGAGLLVGRSF